MMYGYDEIGKTIKKLRNMQRKTQEELSGLSGISRTHLAAIEKGKKNLRFETLCKIAEGLNMPVSRLVVEIEKDNNNNSSGDYRYVR